MRKKFLAIIFVFLVFGYLISVYNQPVFKAYSNNYTVYLGDNSSNARQRRVDNFEYFLTFNKYGESCSVNLYDFNVQNFAESFNAQPVFSETLEHGECLYFYSPSVKYLQSVNGKKVNLQVFIGEDRVVLGSPLIYGGY